MTMNIEYGNHDDNVDDDDNKRTKFEPEHDPHKSLQASSLSAYAGQCPSLIIKMTMHRFS